MRNILGCICLHCGMVQSQQGPSSYAPYKYWKVTALSTALGPRCQACPTSTSPAVTRKLKATQSSAVLDATSSWLTVCYCEVSLNPLSLFTTLLCTFCTKLESLCTIRLHLWHIATYASLAQHQHLSLSVWKKEAEDSKARYGFDTSPLPI